MLEIPVEALRERYGNAVEVDEEFFRNARVDLGDHRLEVGFAGKYRMFGALIDTQWVAERGILGAPCSHAESHAPRGAPRGRRASAASAEHMQLH